MMFPIPVQDSTRISFATGHYAGKPVIHSCLQLCVGLVGLQRLLERSMGGIELCVQ